MDNWGIEVVAGSSQITARATVCDEAKELRNKRY